MRGAATIGVFLVPWFLATAAAQLLRRLVQHAWLHAFSRGAGPAVVALLVVGARGVIRATYTGPLYGFIALAALALGLAARGSAARPGSAARLAFRRSIAAWTILTSPPTQLPAATDVKPDN